MISERKTGRTVVGSAVVAVQPSVVGALSDDGSGMGPDVAPGRRVQCRHSRPFCHLHPPLDPQLDLDAALFRLRTTLLRRLHTRIFGFGFRWPRLWSQKNDSRNSCS